MLSLARLRADARAIFEAGVAGADSYLAVTRALEMRAGRLRVADRSYRLSDTQNIFVAGAGKAAARMALAAQAILGERLSGGVVVVKRAHQSALQKVKVIEAGHPIPDEAGLDGARQVADLARRCGRQDLLLFLLSGGGSALLPYPAAGLSLADKQHTTEVLLKSGAKIQEVNAVRKHISEIKGGRLARLAAPAKVATLALSDVIGDSLEVIASGPTVPDSTTYADCLSILAKHGVSDRIPRAVIDLLERGARGEMAETPKPSDALFGNVQNFIVASNRSALAAARQRAEALGYAARLLSDQLEGESRAAAKVHAALIKALSRSERRPGPLCLLCGGETTVTVRGSGLGGRNQEFALAAAVEIDGLEGAVILSGATDGTDGPTEAAGGVVDGTTVARGRAQNLDAVKFLAQNDSYRFLQSTGDLLTTGPTLTNVMDLQVALIA